MRADILIKNGRVVDPANGIDAAGTVAVKARKLVAYEPGMEADVTIDASGCIVTPGIIDFHAHIFDRATDSGINPDQSMLPQSVTAVVDAGCSGVATYRSFLDRLATYSIKTKILLHVCPVGQANHQFMEPLFPDTWNMDKFAAAFETGGDKIHGMKVRISKNIVKAEGARVFYKAIEVARHFKKPLVVHVTNSVIPLNEVADALIAGDVFCHVYQGSGYGIFDGDGKVMPAVLAAKERGVVMDSCHGAENLSFAVAEKALAQGFLPTVISTDLTSRTWGKYPLYGMPHVLSKFLHLGLSVPEIISRVTSVPAKLLGMEKQIGALSAGACADVSILKIIDRPVKFGDSTGESRTGNQVIAPMATILDGTVVYRSHELWD